MPIVLPVSTQDKERLMGRPVISLQFKGKIVAVLRDPQFYPHRKEERICRQFGTSHPDHPYIKVNFYFLFR